MADADFPASATRVEPHSTAPHQPQLKNDLNSNGDYIISPVGIARRDFRGYLSLHSSSAGLNEISMNNLRLRINFFFEISLPR